MVCGRDREYQRDIRKWHVRIGCSSCNTNLQLGELPERCSAAIRENAGGAVDLNTGDVGRRGRRGGRAVSRVVSDRAIHRDFVSMLCQIDRFSNRSAGVIGVLINAYARAGRRSDALRLLAELNWRRQAGYVPPGAFVNAYLGLGEQDQTFAWLDQAYKEQSTMLQNLKVDPNFDPLRSDSRFADLLRRVGLG
jgi:hypothetical protein